jgi:hypothetical protein
LPVVYANNVPALKAGKFQANSAGRLYIVVENSNNPNRNSNFYNKELSINNLCSWRSNFVLWQGARFR